MISLLIVLNGIEMHPSELRAWCAYLLIVLNGIEMLSDAASGKVAETFNRTKWN